MAAEHGQGFVEVADRCFVARYAAWDTTIGAVVGDDGILVVDTRATAPHGAEIRDHVRAIAPDRPIRWVVNTHEHFDHVLGNSVFTEARIHCQATAAAQIEDAVERIREQIRADPSADPDYPDITPDVLQGVLDAPVRLPDETFHSVATIDLGGRYVELVHPGRGHTNGDLVVRVPDADVVYAGDLVEESAPPAFGGDSYPLEWSATLDLIVGMLTPTSVLSPGHGAVVDRDFVMQQREEVSQVAETIRSLYMQGVALDRAIDAGQASWPYPGKVLTRAVERGYQHLADAGHAAGSAPPRPILDLPDLPLA